MNLPIPQAVADVAERAGWTALQSFLGSMAMADQLNTDATGLALVAAVAAGLAVVKMALTERLRSNSTTGSFWGDFAERVGFTFAEVALAIIIVNPGNVSTWEAAYAAALPAALAAAKTLLATKVGQKGTAATLPKRLDPSTYALAA